MSKYIKFFCVALLLLCVFQIPQVASAYSFVDSDTVVTIDVADCPVDCADITKGRVFMFMRSVRSDGRVYDELCVFDNYVLGDGFQWSLTSKDVFCLKNELGMEVSVVERYKRTNESNTSMDISTFNFERDYASWGNRLRVYGSSLYASRNVIVSDASFTLSVDGVLHYLTSLTPTNTPTPSPTPSPTPIPVPNFDVSDTGFVESMSVALEFMRIPIEIAGFEVNMFEIMMFGFACTIVIYLVFAPVKK